MFFFLLWPLFARAPRHWFLENFLLSAPGVQSVFFVVALRWGQGEAPLEAGTGPEQKKNTTQGVSFFLLRPRGKAGEGEAPLGGAKKKHPGWCFFFALAPCRRPTGLLLPLPFAGAAAKKKHPGWCFVFLLRPRADAHSLTAGLGGDASSSPGWCDFFAPAPPGPGWCFFFAVAPPGRSLTHGGLGRFRQGPGGVCFFAAAPPGLFRQ